LRNTDLSYFVGLSTKEGNQDSILSGDRTITTNGSVLAGSLILLSSNDVTWARGLHPDWGAIAMADGHVEQMSDSSLQGAIRKMNQNGLGPTRLLIP
jgi:prepilin-type processing-associated H-X9-DG protein